MKMGEEGSMKKRGVVLTRKMRPQADIRTRLKVMRDLFTSAMSEREAAQPGSDWWRYQCAACRMYQGQVAQLLWVLGWDLTEFTEGEILAAVGEELKSW